jgi:carbon-monoxide dehydrogenase small subunit
MDMETTPIQLEVNGIKHNVDAAPDTTLLEVLRDQLGLKGTKRGCDNGQCGACTVIMDQKAVNACLVLAFRTQGKKIVTIEGLDSMGRLHPIQEAFIRDGALQCGFCTPGMIMSAKAFLDENAHPGRTAIKEALSGNLCRCTGYEKIVTAIWNASRNLNKTG